MDIVFHSDASLRPEIYVLVGAIAERLDLRVATAAEGEPIPGRDLEFVAVLVD
jgi:hypothetical protein